MKLVLVGYKFSGKTMSKGLEVEEWKDIDGFDGLYQISNFGNVRKTKLFISTHGKKIVKEKVCVLKPCRCGRNGGYLAIGLYKNGVRYRHRIHRLVAQHFIPNPQNLPMVDHLNRNKADNRVENLRWCDGKDNRRNCDYNLFFTINGETKILEDWCNQYGIGRSTVKYRLNNGLDILSALTNPIMTPKEARACRGA